VSQVSGSSMASAGESGRGNLQGEGTARWVWTPAPHESLPRTGGSGLGKGYER
jgi:hypothetical protein